MIIFHKKIKRLSESEIDDELDLMNIRSFASGTFRTDYEWAMKENLSLNQTLRNTSEKETILILDQVTVQQFIDEYFAFLEREGNLKYIKNQMYMFLKRLRIA
ncbi:MAG: hypothetical protein AABX16_02765 [Nanoarchaeota archaeon]